MGLTIYQNIPSGTGQLVTIDNLPITVTPNEEFHKAKAALEALVQQAGALANLIQSDSEYNQAIESLQKVKRFIKDVEAGSKPGRDAMNHAKDQLMAYVHELQTPADALAQSLSKETARYIQEKERKRLAEEQRLRDEAERERKRLQREADLAVLREEISRARVAMTEAINRNQPETSKEIQHAVRKLDALDSTPGAFPDPLGYATSLRQAVAFAIQHEQARVAAAKAREEGDKAAARRIEQASKKLEAPVVAPVVSEKIEAAPVVVPKADLAKAKGSYVKRVWRVKRIYDASAVPREFLVVSESLLNEYAKRCSDLQPNVAGVEWELDVRTAGVRS